ncbi:MAG: Flp family type IVb pilin [Comamonas sp.]
MKAFWLKFWRDEEGATAIEYGLIAALIAVAAITGMSLIGDKLEATFQSVAKELVEAEE